MTSSIVKVFVPCDSAALAVGADEVAEALRHECQCRGLSIELVRNGSRGLFWLETLVEVQTPQGRIAYGPVEAADVPGLLDAVQNLQTSSRNVNAVLVRVAEAFGAQARYGVMPVSARQATNRSSVSSAVAVAVGSMRSRRRGRWGAGALIGAAA